MGNNWRVTQTHIRRTLNVLNEEKGLTISKIIAETQQTRIMVSKTLVFLISLGLILKEKTKSKELVMYKLNPAFNENKTDD